MNINESPYQRLIDIIDVILVKNQTTQKPEIYLETDDVVSLPKNAVGSLLLRDFLHGLEKLDGKKLSFELKTPFNRVLQVGTSSKLLRW